MAKLRHFLALLPILSSPVSALPAEPHAPEARQVAHFAPSLWVTVDASGRGTTITPTVASSTGAASATTISPPPSQLTQTGTYTLAPTNAAVTTSTGLSPVATASSDSGEGVFLACTVYKSVDAPFCQPKAGSQLTPGSTYYITWSDSYFSNTSTSIQIQGSYHDGSSEGFTSSRMLASKGFFIWSIPPTFLSDLNTPLTTVNVSFSLVYFQDLYGNDLETVPGPTVIVTSTPFSGGPGQHEGKKTNVVAIAVPVVIVVVVLLLAGLCVWSWRRHGTVPVLGALKRRSTGGGQGYGIRQSATQRTGGGGAAPPVVGAVGDKKHVAGVELTDRDSWSPGASPRGGNNVFREEMERQRREQR
ncbi:hypothetical protein GE09DRAFT_1218968 [Coniochaeta sp. 2T2.1]|nr:hypothetical protein GE09DRAFT_1218968 [Coniochaeta sp. 2T2.1]